MIDFLEQQVIECQEFLKSLGFVCEVDRTLLRKGLEAFGVADWEKK